MSKNYRQGQILKLVRNMQIYTQDELAQELKAVGITATQVTLSRDLRDLRLVKTQEGYQEIPADETTPQLETLARDFLRDVRGAQNLLVLKTDPGYASPIAVALDNEDWDDVVGTIAGDDTVLVVAQDNKTAESVRQRLLEILGR
jgi:transcriptional regulator of arginine metabolism